MHIDTYIVYVNNNKIRLLKMKRNIFNLTYFLINKKAPTPRHGHSGSQSGFGFIQSDLGFSGLSKSAIFGLYESSVRDRFGFYRVRVRVGVSKSSKNRYNPIYFRVPIGSSI